jgi:hypothetical protein
MKTANGAIQGMSTCQLLELADFVWDAEKSSRETDQRAVRNAGNWQLAEAAEQLRRQQRRPLQDDSVETPGLQIPAIASGRRRSNFFRRLWAWLTGFRKENEHAISALQSSAGHESESAAPSRQKPAEVQSDSPARTVESTHNEKEEVQKPKPEVNLRNLNRHVRKCVGETIIGRVSMEMVLAELERRGYPYRPPIRDDGTLVIRECDLTSESVGGFRKVRPGIEKLIRNGTYKSVNIEAITPLRIDCSIENEQAQFRSRATVSLPALHVRTIAAHNLRVDGNVNAESVKAQKLECKDLVAEAVETVTLSVEGNAEVKHLDVHGNASIGSTLNGTLSVRVQGDARIGRLGDNIPATCKVDGKSILELFRERTGKTQPGEGLRPGIAGSADHRIEEAFNTLQSQNMPISPSRLARISSTNYDTARRWLERKCQTANGQRESHETDMAKRAASVRCRP